VTLSGQANFTLPLKWLVFCLQRQFHPTMMEPEEISEEAQGNALRRPTHPGQ
jgi:hypothetical protein